MKITLRLILMVFWFVEAGGVLYGRKPDRFVVVVAFICLGIEYLTDILSELHS